MLSTQSVLRNITHNPAVRSVVFKNAAVSSMAVRRFNATPCAREQSPAAESELLRQQRKVRPVSPHLTIYQPQITWYLSAAHRVTGCAVGGAVYLGALAYLAAPTVGMTFDSATLVSTVAAAPVAVKVLAKTTVAFPFVFHCLNGIRHLVWDAGKCIDIKKVYTTGYAVLGGTLAGSLYLASL
ncbi:succinate dehydrogenase cytochrome b560 subunit [Radiomyces spectabilis]|uniref:succinate dehydrogenase cytochrome b560 subunit n=1 Tax=Radiomyces spectabilis TaxID=64574 RepID=UPI00221F077D|nr:succinate dehydrogenase cytochrome b560 subunit [Radiomyces spectabilis]KAI8365182.1 succinate dehydrogenase cytochrome b560 subunit [Radiomyces spectabilis]